jgi:hypothetical protein
VAILLAVDLVEGMTDLVEVTGTVVHGGENGLAGGLYNGLAGGLWAFFLFFLIY